MDVSGGTSTITAVLAEAAALREEARAWVAAHGGKSAMRHKRDTKRDTKRDKRETAAIAADTEARTNPALFSAMRAAHPDFAQTYTMVFRFIVELDSYDEKVFRNYLEGLNGAWGSREAWLKSQTEYAVALYQHEHPRATYGHLRAYRSRVEQSLQIEDKDFTEAAEFAKEESERIQNEAVELRRRQLISRALAKIAKGLGVNPLALAGALGALRVARESGAEDVAAATRQLIGEDTDALAAFEVYMARAE